MAKLKLRLHEVKSHLVTKNRLTSQGTILIVDDEQENLDGLAAILETKYKVLQAKDAQEALFIAARHTLDIIITDQRMPNMLGTELLQELSQRGGGKVSHLNILLTGYTDIGDLIKCINDGLLYCYLVKPWVPQELLLTIKQAMDQLHAERALELKSQELIKEVEERRRAQDDLEIALRELKETQEKMIMQEKLRALGEMVSGIAHDFNNLLTPITAYSEELIELTKESEPLLSMEEVLEAAQGIKDAAIDGAALIQRLRSSYHPRYQSDLEKRECDAKALIQSALKLAVPRWPNDLVLPQILLDIEEGLGVEVVISDFRQALVNLFCNALDALEEKMRLDEVDVILTLSVKARSVDDHVLLEVHDEGVGMSPDVLAQCQFSFFSTKGESGTGLGLPMVNEMVKRHNGELLVESVLGQGTTIQLRLPIVSTTGQ